MVGIEGNELPGTGTALGEEEPGIERQKRHKPCQGRRYQPPARPAEPEQRRTGSENRQIIGETRCPQRHTARQRPTPATRPHQQQHPGHIAQLRQSKTSRHNAGIGETVGEQRQPQRGQHGHIQYRSQPRQQDKRPQREQHGERPRREPRGPEHLPPNIQRPEIQRRMHIPRAKVMRHLPEPRAAVVEPAHSPRCEAPLRPSRAGMARRQE